MSASKLRDYLMLMRAPLAFTAIADGLVGCGLALSISNASGSLLKHSNALILVAISSCAAYLAGMVFNDYFDRERDRTLKPNRPLASGRISAKVAFSLGLFLLLLSITMAVLCGSHALYWNLGLILSVLAYDGLLKSYRVAGSLAMASCRCLNILFGAAAITPLQANDFRPFAGHNPAIPMALASLCYIFSLTLLSTYEDEEAPTLSLLGGALSLFLTPVFLITSHFWSRTNHRTTGAEEGSWIQFESPVEILGIALLVVLCGLIIRLMFSAWKEGTRATGQNTTRWLIRGTLLLGSGALFLEGIANLAIFNLLLAIPYVLGARWLFKPPKPK
jgi:4-hydroxybenzoate polyprenyltransferase